VNPLTVVVHQGCGVLAPRITFSAFPPSSPPPPPPPPSPPYLFFFPSKPLLLFNFYSFY